MANKMVSARLPVWKSDLKALPGTAGDRQAEIEKGWCKP
ncbi:hypothetical protein CHCC15337_2412 [Bacillus paralicheniformis]|nr:hypothetical protein CHCC5021_2902 [Bacillus paralicheniformis]TWL02022.1 hypothetical protein CHCC19468_0201 [Bacillus paralicheniformis]TWL13197.1 hypothetical protein CHCC19467_3353 [Bacillus paralicheniformis]TWL47026.1 hypothetical protein CHCC15337_2412 [Bacillus paralicheniformis]TWL51700.1 hypothetical protein CHCC15332_2614 [Bacillus paralicheniformis]